VLRRGAPVRILFSLTALLGAFLLFLVEPMFARMVLPLLGGAPAAWNTCLVFYQVALLVGYLYAHKVGIRPRRQQVVLQIVLLTAAAVVLPITVRAGGPPPYANPIGWVFWSLLLSLGLPFVVLATTGPLLQRWYASLGPTAARTVYSLFSASNVGSFLALLGYPFVVEPLLRLRMQSVSWTIGFGAYALMMAACGMTMLRGAANEPAVPVPVPASGPRQEPAGRRLRWLGLAAVPSTLMMSVTTFISTDIASMPLLWVVPLALYLLTFVIAFSDRQWIGARLLEWLFANSVVIIIALVIAPPVYPLALIVAHLVCFLIVALACHTALAASRPPAESLTEFYLWLSAGGALGGLFNVLVAPFIFVNPVEYPLAAVSACLLLPDALSCVNSGRSRVRQVRLLVLTALPVLLVALIALIVQRYDAQLSKSPFFRFVVIFGPASLAAFSLRRSHVRMGVALVTLVAAGTFIRFDNHVTIHLERSFFGVHRVVNSGRAHTLLSGTTSHGAQSTHPALNCEPLTYYSRGGPIGQLMTHVEDEGTRNRFGVVGLGTASMAAYAQRGQSWTFFEINPVVERLARDLDYFTYLRDCGPQSTVVNGDARLMMVRQPDAAFDVLILDAFSSDAIPVHLITLEAMQLYLEKLAPGGIMAVHISNRYLDLAPVVGATARRAGLVSMAQTHFPTPDQANISRDISASVWVLVARTRADFGALGQSGRWSPLDDVDGPVWTDDYSNVAGVLRH